jgi:hypothetical protein
MKLGISRVNEESSKNKIYSEDADMIMNLLYYRKKENYSINENIGTENVFLT